MNLTKEIYKFICRGLQKVSINYMHIYTMTYLQLLVKLVRILLFIYIRYRWLDLYNAIIYAPIVIAIRAQVDHQAQLKYFGLH